MSSFRTRLVVALAAVLALVVAGWYAMFVSTPTPRPGAYRIDLDAIRKLADAPPEELPREIHFVHVADGWLPRAFSVADNGLLGSYDAVYGATQLVFADHTVVIDTAYDRSVFESIDGLLSTFSDDGFAELQRGMLAASDVVVTHEHADHIAGLSGSPNLATLRENTRLTREQVDHALEYPENGFTAEKLAGFVPLDYDAVHRLAPGVVLVKAPGHSPGSQMVYVKRADGRELLYIGDIAWHHSSIDRPIMRPLHASLFLHEVRQPVADQLLALHDLAKAHPELTLVPAHDAEVLRDLVGAGLVIEGFAF